MRKTKSDSSHSRKQIVFAPQPVFASFSQLPTNRVISVEFNGDEEIKWIWTFLPNGEKYVSGYTIIKKI
jgi:hypothetical protein